MPLLQNEETKRTMTKKRMAEVYRFLSVASMKKMNDDEKVAFIRLLRQLKPVFTEMQEAVNDAIEKAKEEMEDESHIAQFVEKVVEDLAQQEVSVITNTMSTETFNRLCISNDWSFAQIDELEAVLVKPENES